VTASKAPLQLQPLPPGAGPDQATMRPARGTAPSAPPPPLAPITAADTIERPVPRRQVNEPAFVTDAPRMTFDLHDNAPVAEAPPRLRWPVAVGAVLLFGAAGIAAALIFKAGGGDDGGAASDAAMVALVADAAQVIELTPDAAELVAVDVPVDAGAGPDARRGKNPNARDAGLGVAIDLRDGGTLGRTPGERGNVSIEVITRPDGGILYIDQSYRGPGGTHLEERKGTRVKVKCTLPGYEAGHIDLVFDGKTEVAICSMTRTAKCVPGIKNPFDDCPD
jgi:hypothetical protein